MPLEFSCSVIHLSASYSVIKPLITSVSPSGHRISTPQPDPGFFRATKVGRCSDIVRICPYGGPVQASYPATIKLTSYLDRVLAARNPVVISPNLRPLLPCQKPSSNARKPVGAIPPNPCRSRMQLCCLPHTGFHTSPLRTAESGSRSDRPSSSYAVVRSVKRAAITCQLLHVIVDGFDEIVVGTPAFLAMIR